MPSSANFATSCSWLLLTICLMATKERHVQRTVNNGFDLIDNGSFVCSLSPTSLSTAATSPKDSSLTSAQHTRDAAVSMHPRIRVRCTFESVEVEYPSLSLSKTFRTHLQR